MKNSILHYDLIQPGTLLWVDPPSVINYIDVLYSIPLSKETEFERIERGEILLVLEVMEKPLPWPVVLKVLYKTRIAYVPFIDEKYVGKYLSKVETTL